MSPLITLAKTCPDCRRDAYLTGWKPPHGYDPMMRQYQCPECGNEFYVIGGEKTYQTEALPIEGSEVKA